MTAVATAPVKPDVKPWPDVEALVARSIANGMVAPEGLAWAWKSVRRDLRTFGGYRWPFPGGWAEKDPTDTRSWEADGHECPSTERGGFCLAKTVSGAASGGTPLGTALLCGYDPADVLGESAHKLRVRRAYVLDVVDLLADLADANLARANLAGAYLAGANLAGANLAGANLARADLARSNLARSDLADANLADANLTGAYLAGADLARSDLADANLAGATYSQLTIWPAGFDPSARGAVRL